MGNRSKWLIDARRGNSPACKALSSPEKPLGALKGGNGKNSFSPGFEKIHSMIQFSHNRSKIQLVYIQKFPGVIIKRAATLQNEMFHSPSDFDAPQKKRAATSSVIIHSLF
jgi:hypothetical protein